MTGCRERENPGFPAGSPGSGWAWVPPGEVVIGSRETMDRNPPRRAVSGGFWLGRRAVTVREFARFLSDTGARPGARYPDLSYRRGRWRAARFRGGYPARGVTRAEAEAYCAWLSGRLGRAARLPTADEWEIAARGGLAGARYPWGWGHPRGRARFAASGPVRAGSGRPNRFGLRNMSGNVFEWCSDPPESGEAIACGGAWSEPDERRLRVFERTGFPIDYRGEDAGFRVLLTAAAP